MKEITKYLPIGITLIVLYFVWRKFFGGVGNELNNQLQNNTTQAAKTEMANGYNFVDLASLLIDSMFSGGFAGRLFHNADEEAIGKIMLTVRPDEFARLNLVYTQLKPTKLPTITISRGGTLVEDLIDVFNKDEQKRYLGHLNIL